MERLRRAIDDLDDRLAEILQERFKVVRHIAKEKRKTDQPINQEQREQEIIARLSPRLGSRFTEDLFGVIFKESKRIQEEYK